eukprot:2573488-Amphidinium_carterae.1
MLQPVPAQTQRKHVGEIDTTLVATPSQDQARFSPPSEGKWADPSVGSCAAGSFYNFAKLAKKPADSSVRKHKDSCFPFSALAIADKHIRGRLSQSTEWIYWPYL